MFKSKFDVMGEHGPTSYNILVIGNENRNAGALSRKVKRSRNQRPACVTALFLRIKSNLELLVKLYCNELRRPNLSRKPAKLLPFGVFQKVNKYKVTEVPYGHLWCNLHVKCKSRNRSDLPPCRKTRQAPLIPDLSRASQAIDFSSGLLNQHNKSAEMINSF